MLAGEPEAFDRFVEHFRAKIFHYSWMMCGQREDAEEVVQEALLKVFEHLGDLRDPAFVRPWVFRIAKNACLMKRRKSVFAPAREMSLEDCVPCAAAPDPGELPDRQFLDAETRRAVDRAIAALPDSYKSVMLLRDVEELSTAETAHVLDVTEDVVKTRLHRARAAVRKALEQDGK